MIGVEDDEGWVDDVNIYGMHDTADGIGGLRHA